MKDNNNSLAVPNLNIPPEVVLGMAKAIAKVRYQQDVWAYLGENEQEICLMEAEAAARAMLAAWPGVSEIVVGINKGSIILPVTEPRE